MAYTEHFSIANIPYGIASDASHANSVATRLGDNVFFVADLDLNCGESMQAALVQPTLNALAAQTREDLKLLRASIQKRLSDQAIVFEYGKSINSVTLHMPVDVREFTDYSCSKEHGENASVALFGKSLVPESFPHCPLGYSGRPSSIVVSGTPIRRPCGLYKVGDKVEYGVCKALDYELEMACIIGKPSNLGEHVPLKDADDHVFGLVLLNDWSARDIQGFEMMPLGPMNGKSFGTSISPWVVTTEALAPFEAARPHRDEPVTAFLQDVKEKPSYNITLEAEIVSKGHATRICRANVSWMYWTFRDLQDGDTLRMTGCAGPGVGFGECVGLIIPARSL